MKQLPVSIVRIKTKLRSLTNLIFLLSAKCDEEGTALNYEVISEAVCSVRACKPLSADWKKRIDEDVKKRGK